MALNTIRKTLPYIEYTNIQEDSKSKTLKNDVMILISLSFCFHDCKIMKLNYAD
jgi:hypothetical protein